MPSEDKYVLRHEWERANRNIDGKINEVDNKHIALHNDLKLLVTRLNDSNDALIQSQLTTNKTLKKINDNLIGFNNRIKDVEHTSDITIKRLDSIENFVSERQKGNMQIWVAIIGAISTVLVGALGFAATFF